MSMNKLSKVVGPPPPDPVIGSAEGWSDVEAMAGKLPSDYVDFARSYGAGCIAGFFWIFVPGTENDNLDMIEQVDRCKSTVEELRADPNYRLPFRVGTEPGDLFPVGCTDNGDLLFWQIQGDADHWKTVVLEGRTAQWESFDLPVTGFLAAILTGDLSCSFFPKDLSELPRSFVH